MHDVIAFAVSTSAARTDSGAPFLQAHVTLLVNGASVLACPDAYQFDAAQVMAQRTDDGYFAPFACSCGVPECAGIGEAAELSLTAGGDVQWQLPELPFRSGLAPALTAGRTPIAWRFERHQYEGTLDALVDTLDGLGRDAGQPINFMLGHLAAERLTLPLRALVNRDRARTVRYLRREAARMQVFGALRHAQAVLRFPDGLAVSLDVEQAALLLTQQRDGGGYDSAVLFDDAALALEQVMAPLRADHAAVVPALQVLPWAALRQIAVLGHGDEGGHESASEELLDQLAPQIPAAAWRLELSRA